MVKTINLDRRVRYILNLLNDYGEGYLVGGALRDILLGIESKDYDFASNIDYLELMHIFSDYNPVIKSEKYQIISFSIDDIDVEISRFRKESGVLDGRNPKNIEFIDNIYDDLERRDFTINALAYNENKGLIDRFNSLEDLENKIIRTVGNAFKRFEEDNLRILRALYFCSKLNFKLSDEIYSSLEKYKKNKKLLISNKNFISYINKILFDKYSYRSLEILYKYNLLNGFIPEFSFNDTKDIEFTIETYKIYCKYNMFEEKSIGYAIFFLKLGKGSILDSIAIAERVLKKLEVNLTDIILVKNLLYYHNIIFKNPNLNTVNRMLFEFRSNKNVSKLLSLIGFINYNKDYTDSVKKTLELLSKIQYIYFKGDVIFSSDLDLNLIDLQNLGLKTDISYESLKQEVYNRVIEENIENDKKKILEYIINKCKNDMKLKMDYSSGGIVYRVINGKVQFLLVKLLGGNWGFPKGHIEEGETSIEAACREIKEETNIDVELINPDRFVEKISYVVGEGILKYVDFYLARALNEDVIIDTNEISDYKWCNYEESLEIITFSSQRNILQKARLYIFR